MNTCTSSDPFWQEEKGQKNLSSLMIKLVSLKEKHILNFCFMYWQSENQQQ
jgi:hypothetical protein